MKTVLIVEDNEDNRILLQRWLEREDYTVLTAENGKIGVDKALAEKPDIVLMDMRMPVMDGYEATRIIKATDEIKGIPVIGVSAHAGDEDTMRAIESGCDGYVTKPIDFERLSLLIEKTSKNNACGA